MKLFKSISDIAPEERLETARENYDEWCLNCAPDNELEAVIYDIAKEAGVEGKINLKKADLNKLRAFLRVASEEDILNLINRFGGNKK